MRVCVLLRKWLTTVTFCTSSPLSYAYSVAVVFLKAPDDFDKDLLSEMEVYLRTKLSDESSGPAVGLTLKSISEAVCIAIGC